MNARESRERFKKKERKKERKHTYFHGHDGPSLVTLAVFVITDTNVQARSKLQSVLKEPHVTCWIEY